MKKLLPIALLLICLTIAVQPLMISDNKRNYITATPDSIQQKVTDLSIAMFFLHKDGTRHEMFRTADRRIYYFQNAEGQNNVERVYLKKNSIMNSHM
jgi:hypothetical protein